MEAYDEAEVSELVGLYVLSKLTSIIDPSHLGDDGLAAVNKSYPQIERFRKNIFQIFKIIQKSFILRLKSIKTI